MSRLKGLFVTPYIMAAMGIGGLATVDLVQNGFTLGWLGVGLVSWPFVGILGWLMMFRPTARTTARLPLILLLALVGVGVGAYATFVDGSGTILTLGLAVGGALGFFVYDFWYSTLDRVANGLAVGANLPEFTLENVAGEAVSSKDFVGAPALLMFYRGNWCPLCMAQIKEIAKGYRALSERGVRIALISPQPHGHTRSLAKKFDVPFDFLVDPDNAAAKKLGIAAPGGLPLGMQVFGYQSDTVLPTVVITDKTGRIVFSDQTDNYRVRPEPDVFLKALDG